uniref:NADH-ubiquinone oxidoreductase chain 6 n=1 Tax=Bifidoprionus rufus TaxID=2546597 RepID=A0A6H0N225_9CUCU|nr:NADH dehydrogenase subunit 6 [Bifidoprionus rufus]
MIFSFMILVLWSSVIFIVFMNHPLSVGVTLLIQTLLISLITGSMNSSYWFSYILFLIMVGGMLVLFIYMTNVASNEKFKFSMKMLWATIPISAMLIPLSYLDKFLTEMISVSGKSSDSESYLQEITQLTKFISWPLMMNLLLIITYLLIALIMVVKITDIKQGPLRQKN